MSTTPNGFPACWSLLAMSTSQASPIHRRLLTSSCSTPVRSGRTPTTSCTATSVSFARPRSRTRTCRSPSAAVWRRRTAPRSCARRPGSTWCSAPTTSVHSRRCWIVPATTNRLRSRSSRASTSSRPRCPPDATRHTARGCPSRSAATTPARSASSRPFGAGDGPPPRRHPR